MPSKGSAHVDHETSEVQKLIIEFQQMVQLGQASLMDAMRNMPADLMRDTANRSPAALRAALL